MFSSYTNTLPNQFYSSSPLFLNNHEAFSATASADIFLQPAAFSLLPNNLLTATLLSAETLSNINAKQDINCCNIDQNQMNGEFSYKQPRQQESEMQKQTVFVSQKKDSRKDRHSKIYTSQGLRDRRVRLSVDIARRFFDLQDMLGFDKASKTLGWLLSKSKAAIQKLDKASRSPSSSPSSSALSPENGLIAIVSSGGKNEKKAKKRLEKYTKESRAKARERARERTRIKMLKQQSMPNQELPNPNSNAKANDENFTEETTVVKRKLKPPSSSSTMVGYQQNLVMLRDLSCNNNNFNSPNFTPNWEFNNAIVSSSFCAITNMNRSAGMHLYGKVREADNGT